MVVSTYPDLSLDIAQQETGVRHPSPVSVAVRPMGGRNVRWERERLAAMMQAKVRYGLGLDRCARTLALLALLFTFAYSGGTAHAQSASSWNRRGQNAEAREDYDAAFEAYRQAHLKNPKDLRYRERYERLRYTAANLHVDRGRVLRQSGDVTGAINEFARALQIDPGHEAAAQELQLTQRSGGGGAAGPGGGAAQNALPPGQTLTPAPDEQMPHQREVQSEISSLAAPVQLQPVSNDPITLHMTEDTKNIYQAIGKLAGINVIFDPEYSSKRIQVDLTSVPLFDALRIVETLSQTFWKPVTPNTIFVAQNTRNKRTDLDDLAVQTFYLTNVSQQNDANEILVALRNVLDPTVKIYLVNSQNAIVVRATPDQLILAEKLISDLDRTRSEVIVDVAVLEASRDKIRNLGITLPTSFGLTPQQSNANTTTSSTSTGSTSTGTSTGASTTPTTSTNLTLNSLGNLNATNFAVTVSGGTVNALLSDNDTRILQNPRIRATDGQRAQLKIGSKIPVATGSYSSTLSTTASLGIQTQFTYLDVGVNIDITPTVHFDREVSLKLKVEISAQNGYQNISGVQEPVITQRVAEQVIQLKDGEPSILAGLLQRQDSRSVSGTPGLGEIPLLKYFFSTQGKEQQTDEIVFLLIPHIVRESLVTADNTRPIYTGTSNSVELIRHASAAASGQSGMSTVDRPVSSTTSAANAANSMLGVIGNADRPSTPATAAPVQPAAPVTNIPAAANQVPINLSVSPSSSAPATGSTFQVSVMAANAKDLFEVPLQMRFDPRVLSLVNVDSGDFLGKDGQAVALVHRDEGNGTVTISASRPPQTAGISGGGVLCTLTFRANAAGDSPLSLVRIGAKDSHGATLPAIGTQGVVHVK